MTTQPFSDAEGDRQGRSAVVASRSCGHRVAASCQRGEERQPGGNSVTANGSNQAKTSASMRKASPIQNSPPNDSRSQTTNQSSAHARSASGATAPTRQLQWPSDRCSMATQRMGKVSQSRPEMERRHGQNRRDTSSAAHARRRPPLSCSIRASDATAILAKWAYGLQPRSRRKRCADCSRCRRSTCR